MVNIWEIVVSCRSAEMSAERFAFFLKDLKIYNEEERLEKKLSEKSLPNLNSFNGFLIFDL